MTKLTVAHLAAFEAKLVEVENSSSERPKFEAARWSNFTDFSKIMSSDDAYEKAKAIHSPKLKAFEAARDSSLSTLKAAIVEARKQIEQARVDTVVAAALALIGTPEPVSPHEFALGDEVERVSLFNTYGYEGSYKLGERGAITEIEGEGAILDDEDESVGSCWISTADLKLIKAA